MRPVIEGVAQSLRDRFRPSLEFFARRGVTRTKTFGHSVGPHRAPLVVIPAQPELGQIGKLVIARDLLRREMAVIVEDRLRLGVAVIQLTSLLGGEKKIFVDERAGGHRVENSEWSPCHSERSEESSR